MVADLPDVPVEFFIETSWMALSFGTALKDTAPIPAEARVLQEKFIELATHLHTITPETRVLTLFYRAADQGNEDRKSVVSGKSVSVRVDLGGRRIITNKNNHNKHN